jgi:hypothetical protein
VVAITDRQPYASPPAFRNALTDKLRALASSSRWDLHQLQRQIAYDRLLERLYLGDEGWIVKGTTALIARELAVRATVDIDVYRDISREVAEAELRQAAAMDIGDWFRFEVGPAQPIADEVAAVRIAVTTFVGATEWQSFAVDLVGAEVTMTGAPEHMPALARVLMPNVEQHGYRVYPLVDHIADKIVAFFQRYGGGVRPSTRYRDLVDLVAIVTATSVSADAQLKALSAQAERRGLTLPTRFDVPDRTLWESGYAAEAGRSLLTIAKTLDDALDIVSPFIDPVLDATAAGTWHPKRGAWAT